MVGFIAAVTPKEYHILVKLRLSGTIEFPFNLVPGASSLGDQYLGNDRI